MTDILKHHEQFKIQLKEKWLNYYQDNRIWLKKLDGHGQSISNSWFILGIITALEPSSELKELLQYFLLVTKDCNSIIRALGLDFDPELVLKKRCLRLASQSQPEKTHQPTEDSQYLDRVREEIKT